MKKAASKKKSSSSSRTKNYYGISTGVKKSPEFGQPVSSTKNQIDLQNSMLAGYQGGKFLRGRKYSFPINKTKEKRKSSDPSKISQLPGKSKLSKNSMNLMLNVGSDPLGHGNYEDLLNYNLGSNRVAINKNPIKYSAGGKKKKSNSAQSSPHRQGVKTSKNQSYTNALGINGDGVQNNRPYSAKNSGYGRAKSYSAKGKR